ncbi:hypothetical protein FXO38_34439 [Capsicum annuum]|uniref:Uncharacterized protein n=1 Tax=Capsicum annuum TaxID=4072 RepID=A0A2G3A6Q2_CAPAN|nr:hypothetical protein FXO38_34439 [Capsicum annuum]KAF3648486.1 hypothetical protein FXO37_19427 [Capsicum annuum]PHT89914.1 hypothetical protein T459_05027 [Capsicum annuum]
MQECWVIVPLSWLRRRNHCLPSNQTYMLLELLSGKCAGDVVSGEDGRVDLTDWVRLKVAEGHGSDCFDNVFSPEMRNPATEKQMKEVLGIAVRCIPSVSEGPGIKTIYEDLSSI